MAGYLGIEKESIPSNMIEMGMGVDYLAEIIWHRRRNPLGDQDLISQLVMSEDMSDDLIRDQLLTLLIAGHDTSTAFLAWTLFLLADHPRVYAKVRAEVDRSLTGSELAKSRAAQALTSIMIPEALDYPA